MQTSLSLSLQPLSSFLEPLSPYSHSLLRGSLFFPSLCQHCQFCYLSFYTRLHTPSTHACTHLLHTPRSTHACTHPPHLGRPNMSLSGCNAQAAVAVLVREHEQVFAAGFYQHLRPCRSHVCDYGVHVSVFSGLGFRVLGFRVLGFSGSRV